MVLPESGADAGLAQAWAAAPLQSIRRLFARSEHGVIILMLGAVPTRLGEVVRFFSDEPPWIPRAAVMRVCLGAADLADVAEGSRMLLQIRAEEIGYLNVIRPYFAERRPRAVFWVDEEVFRLLRSRAPDLFSFVFRVMEVPPRRWPEFAEQGVSAAIEAGVPFAWDGEHGELRALLVDVGRGGGTVELRTSMSSREMLRTLERPGLPVVAGIERAVDSWRVRMALARAGRDGAWVALRPRETPRGLWRLHARQVELEDATATLRAAGWEQAGAMAAWVDLEPERLDEAAARVGEAPLDPTDWAARRIALADGPAHVLRARVGDADVVAARAELRRGLAPGDAAALAVWSEGAEPWRDEGTGAVEARLVRYLRCLGEGTPEPGSVDAAAAAGLVDVAAELGRIRFERGADDRADRVVQWLEQYGELELALRLAEQWLERARAAGDEGSRGAAHTRLGDLHAARGDAEQARCHYEDGLASIRVLVEREPNATGPQHDLCDTYRRLGDLDVTLGNAEQARQRYEEGLAIARRLVERVTDRTEHQAALLACLGAIGDAALRSGDQDQARGHYEEGRAIATRLLEREPDQIELQRALATFFGRLGDLRRASGDGAREDYEQELAIARALTDCEPARTDLQRDLSVSLAKLGSLLVARGDELGGHCYEEGLAIARALAEREPDRGDRQRDLAAWLTRLGDLSAARGDSERARHGYEEALAIQRALVGRGGGRIDLQRDVLASSAKLGDVHLGLGNGEQARRWYEEVVAIGRPLLSREHGLAAIVPQHLANALAQLARMSKRQGDLASAAALADEALAILRELSERGALDARYVPLLQRLADTEG